MDFLSANSGFAVQNDGTYLPRITRETCTYLKTLQTKLSTCVVSVVKINKLYYDITYNYKAPRLDISSLKNSQGARFFNLGVRE